VKPQQAEEQQPPAPPAPKPESEPDKAQTEYVERWVAARKAAKPEPQQFNERMAALAKSERERIQRERAEAAAHVTTPPPPPAVRLLSNGEPELPLNASVAEMRAASKTQLQDLSRRRGEGRQPRSSGWHGAKF
jgi:hypothetical protein